METSYCSAVSGFTKLFSSIVHSTVWREEMHVKVVWVTMLALANRHGDVLASMPGLADAARVTIEQCEEALLRLSSPDKHSRTKEHEGRRIVECDGGWHLYNYPKYREIRDADERRIQTRDAVRRHRAKKADLITVSNVSHDKPKKAQAEAEAEAEVKTTTLVRLKPDGEVTAGDVIPKVRALHNGKARDLQAAGKMVLSYFNAVMDTQFRWGSKVEQIILSRVLECRQLTDLFYAVDGASRDDTIMGRKADSPPHGYKRPSTVFRDAEQVERFTALARDRQPIHPVLSEMLEAAKGTA